MRIKLISIKKFARELVLKHRQKATIGNGLLGAHLDKIEIKLSVKLVQKTALPAWNRKKLSTPYLKDMEIERPQTPLADP